jgi:CRP-like cAMP-binding protein
MAPVKTYSVRAKRWEHGWELHINGVGVTQSRSLRDADIMARDLISRRTDAADGSFAVDITPEIGEGLDERTRAARDAVAAADQAQRQAAAQSRDTARRLQRAGLTGRDIAAVLKVSPQRVSRLLKDAGRQEAVSGRIAAG